MFKWNGINWKDCKLKKWSWQLYFPVNWTIKKKKKIVDVVVIVVVVVVNDDDDHSKKEEEEEKEASLVSLICYHSQRWIMTCVYIFAYLLLKDISFSFIDVSAPVFSTCPSNILATADRSTTSTQVTWSHPTATDNSGFIPNITHSGKQPGDTFPAGEHNIRYLASDKTGNVGECKFKVFLLGNLRMPPQRCQLIL